MMVMFQSLRVISQGSVGGVTKYRVTNLHVTYLGKCSFQDIVECFHDSFGFGMVWNALLMVNIKFNHQYYYIFVLKVRPLVTH